MIRKEIVNPGRLRRTPKGFGWVDHRLVRKGYMKERSSEALALYLFLVTVGDADGVSYYSRETLRGHLNFSSSALDSSRSELMKADLIAYRKPFYQVLDLPPTREEKSNLGRVLRETSRAEEKETDGKNTCASLGDIINSMRGEQEND